MWIYPYGTSGELLHKWCKLEHFRTVVLCPDFLSQNWTKLSSASTRSKETSCWSVLTTSPLTRHQYFTRMPNHYFLSHASVQRRRGWWDFSDRKAATTAFNAESILPQAILPWAMLTLLPGPLLLGTPLWWGLLYFSKLTDPTFAVFLPYCLIGSIIFILK